MKRKILIIGKVSTFLGIALCYVVMAYILIAGDYEVHSTDNSQTIFMHKDIPTWMTLSPFVTLGVGSILWSIGQRPDRASN